MDKDWREFEKLVARIEGALAPAGAVVKAGDWIRNNLTGRKRQVDASIRYTIGTVPILITVECRRRKHKQDDTWIEQLVTKKQNLGAARTIAVASQDISEQAKRTANFYGIEFRRISEITQDDMLGWLKIQEIKNIIYYPVIDGSIEPRLYGKPGESSGRLHPSVVKLCEADPGNAQVLVRISDKKTFSVNEILDAAIQMGLDLHSGVPLDGTKVRKNVVINFPKGLLNVLTEQGPRDLARLSLCVDVHASVKVVPIPVRGFEYIDPKGPVVYGIEAQTELFSKSVIFSFHKRKDSDVLHVTISEGPSGKTASSH
jgi:hypothetical protein